MALARSAHHSLSSRKKLANLTARPIPENLLSQYLPNQYQAIRTGALDNQPQAILQDRVREVIRIYAAACRR